MNFYLNGKKWVFFIFVLRDFRCIFFRQAMNNLTVDMACSMETLPFMNAFYRTLAPVLV